MVAAGADAAQGADDAPRGHGPGGALGHAGGAAGAQHARHAGPAGEDAATRHYPRFHLKFYANFFGPLMWTPL